MSAPHVAGAIALMHAAASLELAQYYEEQPDLAAQIFKSMILTSVDTLTSLQGITVSGGRLNLYQAVQRAAAWVPSANGDLNWDDQVNIQDVIVLVNLILGLVETTPELLAAADLNYDTQITVQDLIYIIDVILQ